MHDDLCPCINKGDKRWCECALIREVRADERARILDSLHTQRELADDDQRWADLRAKVEALPAYYTDAGDGIVRDDVLALFNGGSDD